MGIYMGDLILSAILQYMVSASFSCFLWLVRVKAATCSHWPENADRPVQAGFTVAKVATYTTSSSVMGVLAIVYCYSHQVLYCIYMYTRHACSTTYNAKRRCLTCTARARPNLRSNREEIQIQKTGVEASLQNRAMSHLK